MKFIFVAVIVTLTLTPLHAHAGERAGDAALGALSGALVFGPVGLVAGAVVGYTAGPAIARSWRANRHHPRPQVRSVKRPAHVAATQRAPTAAPAAGVVTPKAPAPGAGGPPAQGFE